MPKFGPDSEVSTLRNPSTHEVNAAVGDIKAAASDSLAPVVGAFAKLAAETDDPVAEASVLSILAARKRRGDGPWTAADAAAIKSLVLQVTSTPGRFGAVPTRNVLFAQVCRPEGAFSALVGVQDISVLVPAPGADQKDRHSFVLEWLGHAPSTSQVNLIASITAVMIEVTEHSDVNCRSKKSRTKSKVETAQSPAAAKTDNTASISCAAFLTAALLSSNEPCRLSVLSSFGHLVVACAKHPLPPCRKLSVKLVEVWLEFIHCCTNSISASSSPSTCTDMEPNSAKIPVKSSIGILATIAVEDPDAGVQVTALDAIVSSHVLRALTSAPATMVNVFKLIAHIAAQNKLLITVKDKAFEVLAKLVTATPFRNVLLIASTEAAKAATELQSVAASLSKHSTAAFEHKKDNKVVAVQDSAAEAQWRKLSRDALVFIYTLRAVVKPVTLATLPQVLFATEQTTQITPIASTTVTTSTSLTAATKSASSDKAKAVTTKSQAGSRLQARVLANCIALLSDPLIPLEPHDFLHIYAAATTSPQNCFEGIDSAGLCASSSKSVASTTAAPAALAVLQEVFERRGGGISRLLALGSKVLTAHLSRVGDESHGGEDSSSSVDRNTYNSASEESNDINGSAPLCLLIGRLARPFVHDLAPLYLAAQNQVKVGEIDAHSDAMVALFCVIEAANVALKASNDPASASTTSEKNMNTNGGQANVAVSQFQLARTAVLGDLLHTVLNHLEYIVHCLVNPKDAGDTTKEEFTHITPSNLEEVCQDPRERQSCTGSNGDDEEDCVGYNNDENLIGKHLSDSNNVNGGNVIIERDAITSNSAVGTSEQDLAGFDENGNVIGGGPMEKSSDSASTESECFNTDAETMTPAKKFFMRNKKEEECTSSWSPSKRETPTAAAYQLACALATLTPFLRSGSVESKATKGPYEAIVTRIHRSVVFSPLGGGAALMRLPGLQRPLVHLAQCLPDPQRAIFGLFATAFEEAFNDRFEIHDSPPITSSSEHEYIRVQTRCSAVVGALQALGQICEETASTISTRIKRKHQGHSTAAAASASNMADLNATTAPKQVEGATADDEDGGAEFYLKDLVRQQQCEEEVNRQVSDAVNGGGFLACYRSLVEALALDLEAPTVTRIAALKTLGSYCVFAPTLARQWGDGFLAIAEDTFASPELRATAIGIWGRLGPQVANEELRVCALIRSSVVSSPQNDSNEDDLNEDFEEGQREVIEPATHAKSHESTEDSNGDPNFVPHKLAAGSTSHVSTKEVPVRCSAVRVLAHLIAGERVKARRCLCRIAEGLIDSHTSVVAAATRALRQALSSDKSDKSKRISQRTGSGGSHHSGANNGAALLFEVAFSSELPEHKRHPVAAALLKVLKQIQASLAGLSVAVAREVTQKPSENAPALLLALLPPSPNSVAMLHEALVRGILRSAPPRILRAVEDHLSADIPLIPDAANSLNTKRGTKGGNNTAMASSTAKSEESLEAAAAAARSMVGDLLRTATTTDDKESNEALKCKSKGLVDSESECSDREDEIGDRLGSCAKSKRINKRGRRDRCGDNHAKPESDSSDDFEIKYTPQSSARASSSKTALAGPVDTKEALLRFKRERLEKQRSQAPSDDNKKKKTRGS